MAKKLKIKVCGINDLSSITKLFSLNIDYVGLVFYKNSPRNVSIDQAKNLLKLKNTKTNIVALTVNPDEFLVNEIINNIKPDYLQLHGNEKPARCFELKKRYNVKIIKALEIKNLKLLLNQIKNYRTSVDLFLFDAPKTVLPGGNGKKFNWKLLYNLNFDINWMLAGGINTNNIQRAIKNTKARYIDISSGVETKKGKKSPQLIENFVRRCRNI